MSIPQAGGARGSEVGGWWCRTVTAGFLRRDGRDRRTRGFGAMLQALVAVKDASHDPIDGASTSRQRCKSTRCWGWSNRWCRRRHRTCRPKGAADGSDRSRRQCTMTTMKALTAPRQRTARRRATGHRGHHRITDIARRCKPHRTDDRRDWYAAGPPAASPLVDAACARDANPAAASKLLAAFPRCSMATPRIRGPAGRSARRLAGLNGVLAPICGSAPPRWRNDGVCRDGHV